MLGSVVTDQTVIADLEAGIGTLTRLADDVVDAAVVVVEPTPRSLEIGARTRDLAVARGIPRVIVVANRIHDDDDRRRVADTFDGVDGGGVDEVVVIPDDPQIVAAERAGEAPLDVAPSSAAVLALAALAQRLAPA